MTIDLHKWKSADREALMVLCNAVDRTFLSDRLPYPYTETDADWWLGMVTGNDGKEGVWRAIVLDGQIVGSISVERIADKGSLRNNKYPFVSSIYAAVRKTEGHDSMAYKLYQFLFTKKGADMIDESGYIAIS